MEADKTIEITTDHFTVRADWGDTNIKFEHLYPGRYRFPGTICDVELHTGVATRERTYLSPADRYSERFGRKESLRRAMKRLNFSKYVRTIVWQQFLEVYGK